ncbi:hypothetical protein L499_A0880 [Bordetella holmesii CDC-H635-BH]|nr:hypothetical protein L573_0565 [Bordetella holmesii H620]KAK90690.1 hypothetical protein L499_A0880 [Bordetella holmesii CDC-H635-BH]KCV03917.1 hypothetical protein L498_0571 [Bordetella holmesii CDC-H629-BH]
MGRGRPPRCQACRRLPSRVALRSWITKHSLFSPHCDDPLNDVEWLRLRAGMRPAP